GNNTAGTTDATTDAALTQYDVDRWKQAESTGAAVSADKTMVQQVREGWDQRESSGKGLFGRTKKNNIATRRAEEAANADQTERDARPAGGTVNYMEQAKRKKAQEEQEGTARRREPPPKRVMENCPIAQEFGKQNYLSLSIKTGIDSYFSSNPLNSALLAVDTLGMEGLTLNQVASPRSVVAKCPDCPVCYALEELRRRQTAAQEVVEHLMAPDARQDEGYMRSVRRQTSERKYEVKMLP
ncbi:MAG: hypothetical protein LIO58_08740, partial [Oscillospiraceae bacterium]|nr:hypothetical protein [Oscillospiraceae bacterium]